nr:reverse transcriptase domain-containing protein [Tanacetum cinerariifolium]
GANRYGARATGGGSCRGCTLGLLRHPFDVFLMPIDLGSFNVIIGMDWLAKYHALSIFGEKVIRIPYGYKILIIRGDAYDGESKSKLNIISCAKTQKYIQKGCQVYLAQVTSKKAENKSEEKLLEDVSSVREFPKLFLEDLPGLPPARQGDDDGAAVVTAEEVVMRWLVVVAEGGGGRRGDDEMWRG